MKTRKENPTGLYNKYLVMKRVTDEDGENMHYVKNLEAEYFVLRLDDKGKDPIHIAACRAAAMTYAFCIKDHIPQLAIDLVIKYGSAFDLTRFKESLSDRSFLTQRERDYNNEVPRLKKKLVAALPAHTVFNLLKHTNGNYKNF